MSDVFISYARSTEAEAKRIAEALRAAGYGVWRDDELPGHRAYGDVIEERLKAAKAVVVIWSAEAVKSHWVQSEADRARQDDKLVQLNIDGASLPMPFDRIQCTSLADWSGDTAAPAWRKVAESVATLVQVSPAPTSQSPARAQAVPAASEPLLAVLAFDNLSGDPETAYFSDGVSEEIQQTVARGADLKVIGRASSFQFRGPQKAARNVAAELHATHVLDGSVRRAGSRVRIAAQLVECRTETSLWSERYDRDLTDVFALQDEIAAAVAQALKATFARSPPPPPIDPAVYELFLRANLIPGSPRFETYQRRIKAYEEVVAREPTFSRGWAALANCRAGALAQHRLAATQAGVTPQTVIEAAETALRLDPHAGGAYQALGHLEPWAAYGEREALNDKALTAAPNDAGVLSSAGYFCCAVGRVREGLAFGRRAYELDPLWANVANAFSVLLRISGDVDEASRVAEAALARSPGSNFTINALQFAAQRRDRARVEALTRELSALAAGDVQATAMIRLSQNLVEPNAGSIRQILREQQDELARTGTVQLMEPVFLHWLGLKDEAFELLDQASFDRMFEREGDSPSRMYFMGGIFNTYIGLYRDPRFVRLCAKIGLVAYWLDTDRWPDCADEVAYDFRAEARRAADEGLARRVG